MIAWLLLSCAGPTPGPRAPADGPDDTATAPDLRPVEPLVPVTRPRLSSPPDAVDLDPAPDAVHFTVHAAPAMLEIGGSSVDAWAYDGAVPGPTIRARVGDRVTVDLTNDLPVETTIHWHGLKVPYAMDGVTWQAAPVAPGGSFRYEFTVEQAGTFWYHPHFDSAGQVDRGLYGVFIVEDPAEPVADAEQLWVFDVWGESAEDAAEAHGVADLPGPWLVNSRLDPEAHVGPGSAVRVRVLNASNTGYLHLDWPGLLQTGGDQGLLAGADEQPTLIGPGDRAEYELRPGSGIVDVETLPWSLAGPSTLGEPERLLSVQGGLGRGSVDLTADRLAWPFSGALPSPDPGGADVVYVLTGDTHTSEWLINGEQFPDVTIETLPPGAAALIEVRNLSATEHPFHLHGLTFEVLSVDGVVPPLRVVEDTVNVGIRQTVRLLVVADNPGDWMAHCHILPHAHDGMMTVLRVE